MGGYFPIPWIFLTKRKKASVTKSQFVSPKCSDTVDFDPSKGFHIQISKRFLYIDDGKIARLFVKFCWEYVVDQNTYDLVPNICSFVLVEFAVGRDMQTVIQTPVDDLVEVIKKTGKNVTIKTLTDEILNRVKEQSFKSRTSILSSFSDIFTPPKFIEHYK
jgi:hypothetical protein